jgi:hypothetical protein
VYSKVKMALCRNGLAAIIEEADTPQMFEDPAYYAQRFGRLFITVGNRIGISDVDYMRSRADRAALEAISDEWLDFHGIEQDRNIRGNCLMILGRCFQRGIPPSAETVIRTFRSALKKADALHDGAAA